MNLKDDKIVTVRSDNYDLLIRVVVEKESKQKLVDEMNFKYRYPTNIDFPIFQLLRTTVKVEPDDLSESISFVCGESISSIT